MKAFEKLQKNNNNEVYANVQLSFWTFRICIEKNKKMCYNIKGKNNEKSILRNFDSKGMGVFD
jgi:hypothetical protein